MKNFWEHVNASSAGSAILTGYVGDLKDMPSYPEVINLAKGTEHSSQYVLDFGCGIGRNSRPLAESYSKVIAFDLPNMIDIVPEENKLKNIYYTSIWKDVINFEYDMTLASLVFQHIIDDELDSYLTDLKTNKLVLHSRTWMDDSGTKVLTIVEKYFNIESIEYTKDPNNDLDDHFIALLRSKNA